MSHAECAALARRFAAKRCRLVARSAVAAWRNCHVAIGGSCTAREQRWNGLPPSADPNDNPPVGGQRAGAAQLAARALLEAIMQAGASSQGAFDTSMLSDITALDILRLQAMNSPPRGLVLVIGSLGVLIGLADELPDWAGCQKVLHAQPAKPIARWRGGSGSLWQCLRSFEPANVTPAQRQCVLAAQQADIGGLMTPRHLEGVSGGAAALALWLHIAMQLVDSGPAAAPPQEVSLLEAAADRRESLFDAPAAEQCKACGKRMPIELMAAHVPACRSREESLESARRDGMLNWSSWVVPQLAAWPAGAVQAPGCDTRLRRAELLKPNRRLWCGREARPRPPI